MNHLDAELVQAQFSARGWTPSDEKDADVVVYLTCSVRKRPEEKVFSRIASIRKREGRPVVVVAGCMAQREGRAVVERENRVDLVLGTDRVGNAGQLVTRLLSGDPGPVVAIGRNNPALERDPGVRPRPFQAFVAAARGCSNHCAYCVVPDARGPERSRPVGDIVAECEGLVRSGVIEVTLLAQSISSYGRDVGGKPGLADLLHAVHAIPGLKRLRFLTSQPAHLADDVLHAMSALPRLCRQLHLPAQSGSDDVLRVMKRGYTLEQYEGLVDRARKIAPGVAFTSDFIVGFPGETDADFDRTVALVKRVRFQNIFVFKYSPRPRTRAFGMDDDVPLEVKRERNHILLETQKQISIEEQAAFHGRTVEVLMEGPSRRDPSRLTGREPGNRIVVLPPGHGEAGRIETVRVLESTALTLFGEIA